MTGETTTQWGILGCGDVTEVKSGPALQKAERSKVLTAMRRDGAKARDYAQRHGIAGWTDDADVLLNGPDTNAIYIATPPSTHADYAVRAMRAGKDVLVEKPMAITVSECEQMIAAQKETGKKLVVAYYRRALPRFERFRQIALSGELGPLRMIELRQFAPADVRPGQSWKTDTNVGGGGLFADMQTHALDWLCYTFGVPRSVAGLKKNQSGQDAAEDMVSYLMDFGAVAATGLFSYASGERNEEVVLHCDAGRASMGFFQPSPITVSTPDGEEHTIDLPDPPHVHQPFIDKVVAHFLDDAPNPCSAEDGAQANRLMEQVFQGL
ncbi:MAG: Gfo/Idh/MocA family oxidoreductase [Pseudomonadota bacterium]